MNGRHRLTIENKLREKLTGWMQIRESTSIFGWRDVLIFTSRTSRPNGMNNFIGAFCANCRRKRLGRVECGVTSREDSFESSQSTEIQPNSLAWSWKIINPTRVNINYQINYQSSSFWFLDGSTLFWTKCWVVITEYRKKMPRKKYLRKKSHGNKVPGKKNPLEKKPGK